MFAFAGEAEGLGGGLEGLLSSDKLVEKRMDAGVALDNMAGDCVLKLCSREFGGFEASLGGARTPEVK